MMTGGGLVSRGFVLLANSKIRVRKSVKIAVSIESRANLWSATLMRIPRNSSIQPLARDIQVGMTRDEVFAAIDRRYPKSGARQRPGLLGETADGLSFFMNPETSREPNCEGIFLKLENGRVKSKEYSPD